MVQMKAGINGYRMVYLEKKEDKWFQEYLFMLNYVYMKFAIAFALVTTQI